jgi:hypothetical protein
MRREFRWDIRARQMAEWYGRAACGEAGARTEVTPTRS